MNESVYSSACLFGLECSLEYESVCALGYESVCETELLMVYGY